MISIKQDGLEINIPRVRQQKGAGLFRVVVRRTNKHLYASLCSKDGSYIISNTSTIKTSKHSKMQLKKNKTSALLLGKNLALKAKVLGINKILFERSGFKYHGVTKSLADSARNYGLNF